jgi:hypothetical protein
MRHRRQAEDITQKTNRATSVRRIVKEKFGQV